MKISNKVNTQLSDGCGNDFQPSDAYATPTTYPNKINVRQETFPSSSIEEQLENELDHLTPQTTPTLQKERQRRAYDLTYGIDIVVTSPPSLSRDRNHNNNVNNSNMKIQKSIINQKLLSPPSPLDGVYITDWSHLQQDNENEGDFVSGLVTTETSSHTFENQHNNNFVDRAGLDRGSYYSFELGLIAAKDIGTACHFVDKFIENDGEKEDFCEGDSFNEKRIHPHTPVKIPGNIVTPDDIHFSLSEITPERFDNTDRLSSCFKSRYHDRSGSRCQLASERVDDTDWLSPHDRSYSGSVSAESEGEDNNCIYNQQHPEHHSPPYRKNGRYQWAYIHKTDKNNNIGVAGTNNNGEDQSRKISIHTPSNINKKHSTSSSHSGRGLRHRTLSVQSRHSRTSSFGSTCEGIEKDDAKIKPKKTNNIIMKKLSTISASSLHYDRGRSRGRTVSKLSVNSRASSCASDVSGRSNLSGRSSNSTKWLRKTSMARIIGVTQFVSKFVKNAMERSRGVSNRNMLFRESRSISFYS